MERNNYLAVYLKSAGVFSGATSKETRHSSLSVLKSRLFGKFPDNSYRSYNNFGSAAHSMFLVNKRGKWKLSRLELLKINNMISSLRRNPVVTRLLSQCHTFEKRKRTKIHTVRMGYTADGHGKEIGIDLKTSACTTLEDFTTKAFEYGYFRQGLTYSIPLKLKEFWIIGIGKLHPHPVFLVLVNEHKDKMHYVKSELEFLLHIYKNYGNPKKEEDLKKEQDNRSGDKRHKGKSKGRATNKKKV